MERTDYTNNRTDSMHEEDNKLKAKVSKVATVAYLDILPQFVSFSLANRVKNLPSSAYSYLS